jgi:hypothetical protein
MPRGPGLDVPGTLHPVMGWGIERLPSFQNDDDRADFVTRCAGRGHVCPFPTSGDSTAAQAAELQEQAFTEKDWRCFIDTGVPRGERWGHEASWQTRKGRATSGGSARVWPGRTGLRREEPAPGATAIRSRPGEGDRRDPFRPIGTRPFLRRQGPSLRSTLSCRPAIGFTRCPGGLSRLGVLARTLGQRRGNGSRAAKRGAAHAAAWRAQFAARFR